ncbi:MAG: type II toxin-antitoxin system VapC family toxin [Solirubrobacterales bacterium]
MTALLLDSSVVLAAINPNDPNSEAAHRILFEEELDLTSIDLIRYEIANVTSAAWREPEKTPSVLAIAELLGGHDGLRRSDTPMLVAASEVATEYSISTYDAAYVVAARSSGRTLVSCDERDLVAKGLAVLPADAL